MVDFVLKAQVRHDTGKGASRRLRRLAGQVPAIVYGGAKSPAAISLRHDDVLHALEQEAFYSHLITLEIEGIGSEEVILKDVQRHPAEPRILHLDFQRVDRSQKIHVRVPIHFLNEDKAKGVKAGGIVQHALTELDVQCLPQDLPEFIEVDLIDLDVGDVLHISDLKLPPGVESTDLLQGPEHDLPVVSILRPRVSAEEEEREGEAPAEE